MRQDFQKLREFTIGIFQGKDLEGYIVREIGNKTD